MTVSMNLIESTLPIIIIMLRNYVTKAWEFKHGYWFTDIAIGFNQTLYEVNENESVTLIFVTIISGILRREVAVNVSTQDDTALGTLALAIA
jgi:hypothetical protein